jgi:hypothetical protein
MPMWRCPHCATPQAETARCWVCHRSSTACGACRHFRRAVAGQLGYCGLDRQRQPLTGDEIRPCWEAADATGVMVPPLPGIGPVWPLELDGDRTAVQPIQFVEVPPGAARNGRAARATAPGDGTDDGAVDPGFAPPSVGSEPRWSLWGDVEA